MYTYVHAAKPDSGPDLVLLADLECPRFFSAAAQHGNLPDPRSERGEHLLVTVAAVKGRLARK